MRSEQTIFDELTSLCSSPGYVHVIAYFCFRDNLTFYSGEIQPENMQHLFSRKRLIRTEVSTLLGLLHKSAIDFSIPAPESMQAYIDKTEVLLQELHETFSEALFANFDPSNIGNNASNPFTSGASLREPIFYGGESAYSFQYRDLSPRKYARDDEWLKANKGFSIHTARDVAQALGRLLDEKATAIIREMRKQAPADWKFLPAYTFTAQEIATYANIDLTAVKQILQAFAVPADETNKRFTALNDFNVANAMPLIPAGNDVYILLHIYSFVEAIYESPFFWMGADKRYVSTAMKHRGQFTEEFATERLALVFGKENVYPNVDIFDSKGTKFGEIDVLVLFGNRIIVLQAKSKRLTIEARKGNDLQIRDDFKKSIQDSCEQACRCAVALGDTAYILKDAHSKEVTISTPARSVYILCLVSDHYPALSFQSRQFLTYQATDAISSPFVLDIFTLDAMTEMLCSPLRLLSYIDRRTYYADKIMATHESVILSYHLMQNLWLEEEISLAVVDDNVAMDLDSAMTVRREGIAGKRTPDGMLTRFDATSVGRLVREIEAEPNSATIDLGYMLLSLNEATINDVSNGIDKMSQLARADGNRHDLTIGVGAGGTGLTIHCNDDPLEIAGPALERHCVLRKYKQHAQSWFGICISPQNTSIKLGLALNFKWELNQEMDALTRNLASTGKSPELMQKPISRDRKIGRNELCPCGSGKKFKRCCHLR